MPRTWLITGASRGLGRALGAAVLARGDSAVLGARDTSSLDDLVAEYPDRALAVSLDVTDAAQITAALEAAAARFDGIDVLVNNAGYGYRSAVEEGDDDEIRAQLETNLLGPIALIKAALPSMRARRSGTIVNVSSAGVLTDPPGSGYYVASKAALEHLSGSLRKEVSPVGIDVIVVEPGRFRTDFSGPSLELGQTQIDDYADTVGAIRSSTASSHGTQPGDPAKGAELIVDVVHASTRPELLLLGTDAVDWFDERLVAVAESVRAWRARSVETDFDA